MWRERGGYKTARGQSGGARRPRPYSPPPPWEQGAAPWRIFGPNGTQQSSPMPPTSSPARRGQTRHSTRSRHTARSTAPTARGLARPGGLGREAAQMGVSGGWSPCPLEHGGGVARPSTYAFDQGPLAQPAAAGPALGFSASGAGARPLCTSCCGCAGSRGPGTPSRRHTARPTRPIYGPAWPAMRLPKSTSCSWERCVTKGTPP